MRPISASLTEAQTCIRRRSLAIKNRLGAFKLATTVWPILTRRATITFQIGDLIIVYPRLVCAVFNAASFWRIVAFARATLAFADL